MAFTGWPAEAIEFFEGLEADNSRTYWQANKDTYDELVRRPMESLLAELEPEFGAGKIFRPNRDTRFSRDKSPYKTTVAATTGAGQYVQFSANGLACGAGMWHMAPDQLERFRAAVDDDRTGRQLERIVGAVRAAGLDIGGHETLKTAPRGYPKDHPRIELLRAKGFVTWKEWRPAAWMGTRKAKDRVVEFFHTSKPVNDWLATAVGPSHLPPDRP